MSGVRFLNPQILPPQPPSSSLDDSIEESSKEDHLSANTVWLNSRRQKATTTTIPSLSSPLTKSSPFYLVTEEGESTISFASSMRSSSTTANMSSWWMDRIFHYFNREGDEENFEYRKNSMGGRLKFIYLFYLIMVGSLGFLYIDGITQNRFVFYVLIGSECILNALVIRNIESNIPMAKKEALNVFMTLFSCANRIVLQIHYGPNFPLWGINTCLIVISSNSLYFKKWTTLFNCLLILATTQCSLYFSYLLMEFRADTGEIYGIGLERKAPMLNGFSCLNSRKFIKMTEICIMQIIVTTSGFMFSDVSEKQYGKIFRQQMEIMKEKVLNASKTKYIGNISHEIRNPLHGVVGSIQILKHEAERLNRFTELSLRKSNSFKMKRRKNSLPNTFLTPNDCIEELTADSSIDANTIIASNQSSLELIDDIYNNSILLLNIFSRSLQLSNLELGQVKLNLQNFDMLELLETMTSVFYTLAYDKGISIQSFFDFVKVPLLFRGDQVKISQVLMNIISNSIKYTKKGYVLVTCSLCDDSDFSKFGLDEKKIQLLKDSLSIENEENDEILFVKFECHDTGLGISENNLKTLFKPFRTIGNSSPSFEQYYSKYSENQKDITNSSFSDRNGLGLSICKRFCDVMNGKVGIESEVGNGTTISIVLPLMRCVEKPEIENFSKKPICEQLASLKNMNIPTVSIYIVDHNICLRKVLKDYLLNVFEDSPIYEYDSSECIDIGKTDINKILITIYSDEMNETIQKQFQSYQSSTIFIPLSNRGFSKRTTNFRYLTRPLRIGDLLNLLIDNLIPLLEKLEHSHSLHFIENEKVNALPQSQNYIETLSPLQSKAALVVDDNEINRKVLQKMLKMVGIEEIDVAENGLVAFEKYKENPTRYRIIFMDLLMPFVSGKESCELIRNHPNKSNALIVAVTANVWESKEVLCKAGFDSVIYKPILLNSLQKELSSLGLL